MIESDKTKPKKRNAVFEWIRDILIALAIGFLILQLIKPTIVLEHSMEPTLKPNNYIFLSRQAYHISEPKHGDIIVFKSDLRTEKGEKKLLIKRIIGVPGDTIAVADGKVVRNGIQLVEDYTLEGFTAGKMEEVTVPKDHVFVMGDNRQYSIDSRSEAIGFVNKNQILGKAFLRLFPFNQIGFLNNGTNDTE